MYINYKRSHSNFTEIAIFHDRLMKKTARFSKVKLTVDQATVKLDYYYFFFKVLVGVRVIFLLNCSLILSLSKHKNVGVFLRQNYIISL